MCVWVCVRWRLFVFGNSLICNFLFPSFRSFREVASLLSKQQTRSIQLTQLLSIVNESSDINVSADELREALRQLEADEFVKVQSARNNPNPLIRVIGGPSFD